jgi:hypothetical protein
MIYQKAIGKEIKKKNENDKGMFQKIKIPIIFYMKKIGNN